MNKILLISPHFDDAILSAGQFMADRPDTVVLTVFGGIPQNGENVLTPYDEKCGFKNAKEAVEARRWEDNLAVSMLKGQAIHLDFADGQYNEYNILEDIISEIQRIVDAGEYEAIYAPLGLDHPDHLFVSEAVTRLKTDIPITLWEDLPTRVIYPEQVPVRLAQLGLDYNPDRTIFEKKFIADKMRALACYGSQISTGILDPYILYVPERYYKYEPYSA